MKRLSFLNAGVLVCGILAAVNFILAICESWNGISTNSVFACANFLVSAVGIAVLSSIREICSDELQNEW